MNLTWKCRSPQPYPPSCPSTPTLWLSYRTTLASFIMYIPLISISSMANLNVSTHTMDMSISKLKHFLIRSRGMPLIRLNYWDMRIWKTVFCWILFSPFLELPLQTLHTPSISLSLHSLGVSAFTLASLTAHGDRVEKSGLGFRKLIHDVTMVPRNFSLVWHVFDKSI